jgi:phospholipid-binding lipoprotein MlaA
LTLAYWGYSDSNYLVLPFWGPNTIRDGIGIPVDYYGFSGYPYLHPLVLRYSLYGLSIIDSRAQLLKFPLLDEAAVDKYVFMRNAYMQHRAFQVEQNRGLGFDKRYGENGSYVMKQNNKSA